MPKIGSGSLIEMEFWGIVGHFWVLNDDETWVSHQGCNRGMAFCGVVSTFETSILIAFLGRFLPVGSYQSHFLNCFFDFFENI